MRLIGKRIVIGCTLLLIAVTAGLWYARSGEDYSVGCRDALKRGDWKELADLSRAWSESQPDNPDAWWMRAEAAHRQQDFEATCQFLERIPPESRMGRSALESRIDLQFESLNRPQAAATACLELLRIAPDSNLAHQRLIFYYAFTLQRRQMTDQIREAVSRGCEPREAYAYLFLADSLRLSNAGSQNARWLESDPDSELFSVAQAIHIAESLEGSVPRDDEAVLAELKKAFQRRDRTLHELHLRFPRNLELLAYYLRGAVEQGNIERVKELLLLAPDSAEFDNRFWRYRGWILASCNELDQAEVSYRKALKLHPLDWSTRHLLAGLLRRKGDLAQALKLEELVIQAGELRRSIQQQQSVRALTPQMLSGLATYAEACGDSLIADSLRSQLRRFGQGRGMSE